MVAWRDVTEYRRVEEALREGQRVERKLADSSPAVLYIFDLESGRPLYVRGRPLRSLGHDEAVIGELGGEFLPRMMHPEDLARFASHVEALRRTPDGVVVDFEYRMRHADGSWRRFLSRDTIYERDPSGSPRLVLGTALDVTDRTEWRDRIQASEKMFRATFENAAVGIAHVGLDGRWLRVNNRLCEIVGRPREALMGLSFQDITHPEDLDNDLRQVDRLISGEMDSYAMEKRYLREDGSVAWVNLTVSLLRDALARPEMLVSVIEEISDRKQAERVFLEDERRKDEFLAILAHELRNPLAAVRHSLRLLRQGGLSDEDRDLALDVSERQLQNLIHLIEDLLDVSRISTGKILLKREIIDASVIVDRAAGTVRPFIESRNQSLTVSVGSGPMPIDGDSTRLEQILTNLLFNAAKYTEEGGQIRLDASAEGPEVVLRVLDSGVGIDREMLSRVFELFEQVEASKVRAQGGLGIGLMLVKKLAEMHGGWVTAHSEGPGRGSEFSVHLPLVTVESVLARESSPSTRKAKTSRAASRKLLIVDDNLDTLRSMSRLLEISGHRVVRAHDGPSAIEVAREHQPEVVILDIGLPGMSGHEVAEVLRRDGMSQAILIALSGYAQEMDRERSRSAGFDHHLIKPVDIEALLELLHDRSDPAA